MRGLCAAVAAVFSFAVWVVGCFVVRAVDVFALLVLVGFVLLDFRVLLALADW